MILTATEVTLYSNITASAATINSSGLIEILQQKVTIMLNNYFDTDLYVQGSVVFNATARTIVMESIDFESNNFLAGDDILIYNSYRNDGYQTIESVSGSTLTLTSSASLVDELSGRSVFIAVVKWPVVVKEAVAQMIAYDYDIRPKLSTSLRSRTLGPWSETYNNSSEEDDYGYPKKITDKLTSYRKARLV